MVGAVPAFDPHPSRSTSPPACGSDSPGTRQPSGLSHVRARPPARGKEHFPLAATLKTCRAAIRFSANNGHRQRPGGALKKTKGRSRVFLPPRGAEPAPSERLRAREWLAKAIRPAGRMADDGCCRPGGAHDVPPHAHRTPPARSTTRHREGAYAPPSPQTKRPA